MKTERIEEPLDLRRKIGAAFKAQVIEWAGYLDDADCLILEAIFVSEHSLAAVAAAHRISPDTLRKRIRQLINRVRCPEFQFVAKNLHLLPKQMQVIARKCILQCKPIAQVAAQMRLAPHFVRQQRRMAQPTIEMITMARKAAMDELKNGGGS